MLRRYFLVFLVPLALFFGQPRSLSAAEKRLPNVIICTLGGVRNSESINDRTHQFIPNLWGRIFPSGVLYTNLVNLNLSFHQSSVQAINTGRIMPEFCGLKTPSIFQYIIKQKALARDKVWSIGHWDDANVEYADREYGKETFPATAGRTTVSSLCKSKLTKPELNTQKALVRLAYPKAASRAESLGAGQLNFSTTFWDMNMESRHEIVQRILKSCKPEFLHIVMDGTDSAHYDTYPRYVLSLKDTDEWLFEIWQYIQNDPFYKDNTYLFICPDHGRDRYYMQHCDEDYLANTWLYVYGPDIKKGTIIGREIHHVDIFATVARILDLKTPPNDGKVLEDCFL